MRASLEDLRRKYEELLRLRRARAEAPDHEAPREALAKLAAEFPGALRELDVLTLDTIETRVREIAAAERDVTTMPLWMRAQVEYHALVRGALAAKRFLAGAREVDAALTLRFVETAHTAAVPEELLAWSQELASLARPPHGRITALVMTKLAARLDVSVAAARALVLPKRASGAG